MDSRSGAKNSTVVDDEDVAVGDMCHIFKMFRTVMEAFTFEDYTLKSSRGSCVGRIPLYFWNFLRAD